MPRLRLLLVIAFVCVASLVSPDQSVRGDAPATQPGGGKVAGPGTVGWMVLTGALRDGPPPFAMFGGMSGGDSLQSVIAQLHYVAKAPASRGVVIFLDQTELTGAQVRELGEAMAAVRNTGKRVLVFSEAYDLNTYLLACGADKILLQRKGELELTGIGVEEMYLAGTLEKLGMKADFLQVGKYKGAQEPLTRTGPSPEWSQNFDNLLDDLYDQALTRIGTARHLDRKAVVKAFADCWTMSDEDYVKRGLVDHLVNREMTEVTGLEFGDNFTWDKEMGQTSVIQSMDNPFALLKLLFQENKTVVRRPSLAVIHAKGAINSGNSASSSAGKGGGNSGGQAGLFGGDSIGSRSMVRALGDAKDNDLIRGVVIRIDSPGGSALASEVIWQAVRELGQKKPVFISIGSMAASGGYYISCAGDEIYASEDSIVGSIGVVGGKIVMDGFYKWVGLGVHRRSRGPMGDMFNTVEPFTAEQRQALEKAFQRTYDQFTDRVKTGRGKRVTDLGAVAEGRLFSGKQAVANGLIDRIGGLDKAITDLAAQVKLTPGRYDIIDLPEPLTLPEYLDQVFRGVSAPSQLAAEQSTLLRAAQAAIGRQGFDHLRDMLNGLSQLRNEHVLTLMPTAIVVK